MSAATPHADLVLTAVRETPDSIYPVSALLRRELPQTIIMESAEVQVDNRTLQQSWLLITGKGQLWSWLERDSSSS